MKFSAQQIAEFLEGKVEGNPLIEVNNFSKIEEGKTGTLSFLANPKYTKYIYETDSSIVLVSNSFEAEKEIKSTLIRVDDAYSAMAKLMQLYELSKPQKKGISEKAYIHESATIGNNVYVAALAYISENAKIGDNVKIYPHVFIGENVKIDSNTTLYSGVKIYDNCVLGKDCIIHAGTIIGSDGFGFAPSDTEYTKVPQIGNVVIEDQVEIGANCTLDRAMMGSTIIRKGVKLDNQIQVAHNVEIGEHTVIAALTGISGTVKIGKRCMIGGQVGFAGHITIADEVKIGAKSGILSSITEKGAILQGIPANKIKDEYRSMAAYRKLPDLNRRVNSLEKEIKELNEKLK